MKIEAAARLTSAAKDLFNEVQMYLDMLSDELPEIMDRILANPLSDPYKVAPKGVRHIYRAVAVSKKDLAKFRKTGEFTPSQANSFEGRKGKQLPYSTDPEIAKETVEELDTEYPVLVFKKILKPSSVVLDFSGMLAGERALRRCHLGLDEKEVWMQATPYYTTFSKSELVDI